VADPTPPPITSGVEPCYRHPKVETGVHCTRCGRPICPDCMIEAPVGFQCPECVGEARREFKKTGSGPQQIRSMSGTPVTFALIGAIVAVFIVQIATGGNIMNATGNTINLGSDIPVLVAQGQYWRLVTSVFLHVGLIHLALNAYGLYIFGSFVERMFGRVQLIAMFLVTGFFASAFTYALAPQSEWLVQGLGASGAVFGLAGMFFAYAYRRRDTQMGRAMLQNGATFIVLNVIFALVNPSIGWKAHLGGLIAGFIGGFLMESTEDKTRRRTVQVATVVGLLAIGVVLAVYKTGVINEALSGANLSNLFG
jgi:membrane associated rhomboid family serine protease